MFDDWESDYHEECNGIYDTYDDVIGHEHFEHDEPDGLDAINMGLAFALAEEIRDAGREDYSEEDYSEYDLDENTDIENWKKAEKMSLSSRHETRRLRPFEQYIDDICKGRRPLFED
jgi:hypothetical protein